MEEVSRVGPTTWYQAYIPGDPGRIERLIERVAAAGFDTFVVTVDVPVPANRENNIRNGFGIPIKPSAQLIWQGLTHPSWVVGTLVRTLVRHGIPQSTGRVSARISAGSSYVWHPPRSHLSTTS